MHSATARMKFSNRPYMPVGSGLSPYFKTKVVWNYVACIIHNIPEGAQLGDEIEVVVEFQYFKKIDHSHIVKGLEFEVQEGKKIIGSGVLTSGITECTV